MDSNQEESVHNGKQKRTVNFILEKLDIENVKALHVIKKG